MKRRDFFKNTGKGIGLVGMIVGCELSPDERSESYFKSDPDNQIKATVMGEYYENKFSSVPEKHIKGFLSQAYSNETIKLDSKYILKLKTDEGKTIILNIMDCNEINHKNYQKGIITKESVNMAIDIGSKIIFPKGNVLNGWEGTISGETKFKNETSMGTKRADRIKILEN